MEITVQMEIMDQTEIAEIMDQMEAVVQAIV